MSLAGKSIIKNFFRSLRPSKRQAPSFREPFPEELALRIQSALDEWVSAQKYLLPQKNLSDVAESLGTTSSRLHQYFLEVKGEDFRTWRTRLRIEKAKEMLLEDPQAPVSLIARRTGIMDRSNFTRQFTVHTGLTPTQWREREK